MSSLPVPSRRRVSLLLLASLWIAAVGAGLTWLWDYETTPGAVGRASSDWPAGSRIQRVPGRAQLVMFAHPHCPCTRASLGELTRLMADCEGLVTAQVVFFKPRLSTKNWERTDLWGSAEQIPDVQVVSDEDGRECRQFGIETSGHVLLYNPAGKLLFSGGITPSRGHSGDNAGRSAITALLRSNAAPPRQVERPRTFVFGCPLCRPNP